MRENALTERERAVTVRETAVASRESSATAPLVRDDRARARDRTSEQRDDAALRRDRSAKVSARETAAERAMASADRRHSASDRRHSAEDRESARSDRQGADADRRSQSDERLNDTYDELTGVLRRGPGFHMMHDAVQSARTHGRPVVIGFVDVIGLKRVNDSAGHAGAEQLLEGCTLAWRRGLHPVPSPWGSLSCDPRTPSTQPSHVPTRTSTGSAGPTNDR